MDLFVSLLQSRKHQSFYQDTEDRKKMDCGLNHCTVRFTGENPSTHLNDHINSTSVAIMRHAECDEASNEKKSRVGLAYNLSSIHQTSKVDDRKDKIGAKACSGLNICNNSVCTAIFRDRKMENSKYSFGDGVLPGTVSLYLIIDVISSSPSSFLPFFLLKWITHSFISWITHSLPHTPFELICHLNILFALWQK